MSPHTPSSAAAPVHPNHVAESPGQPTSSDHPGEQTGLVNTWLRDSVHVLPDHVVIPSAASYILCFVSRPCWLGLRMPVSVWIPFLCHSQDPPTTIDLVHSHNSSLLPKTEVFSQNIVKVSDLKVGIRELFFFHLCWSQLRSNHFYITCYGTWQKWVWNWGRNNLRMRLQLSPCGPPLVVWLPLPRSGWAHLSPGPPPYCPDQHQGTGRTGDTRLLALFLFQVCL